MAARRRLTAAEREQKSQQMRAAWRSGKFANRRKGMHPRHWTPEQNRALAQLAGTRPVEEIASALERRFHIRRTTPALRIQAKRLGISLWQGGLSMRDMERLFGVDHKHIRRFWVDAGHLAARRWGGRGPNDGWWFETAEVERFVRACGWLFDVGRMQPGHALTRIAETTRKADPWIVGYEALAAVLKLAPLNVKKWERRGLIPHKSRATAGRGGMICVRGRDIPPIREAITQAQADARQRARAGFAAARRAAAERSLAVTRLHADRLVGACKNGHARSLETTRISERGKVHCLACRRDRVALGKAG